MYMGMQVCMHYNNCILYCLYLTLIEIFISLIRNTESPEEATITVAKHVEHFFNSSRTFEYPIVYAISHCGFFSDTKSIAP